MTYTYKIQLQFKRLHDKLPMLAMIVLISACGGSTPSIEGMESAQELSNSSSVDPFNAEQSGTDQNAMGITGTIFIEERNGKTVFDAFFSHNAVSALGNSDSTDIAMSADTCSVSEQQSQKSLSEPVELGAANGKANFASVGAELTIESRVGQFEALLKQQLGDYTVYAPNERWQNDSLPDDAVLSFESDSTLEKLGAVEVTPLLPLVWLTPETGVMANAASTLRWEASQEEQVQIRLRLSAIDFSDSQNPVVVSVSCDLIDDGLFNLPVELQQQLPDDETGIVVYAVRERTQEIKVDDTNLTVVQLSYPAPLQP